MNKNETSPVISIAAPSMTKNPDQDSASKIIRHNLFELDSELTIVNINISHAKLMIDELSEEYFDVITDNELIIYGHPTAALKNQIALHALCEAIKTLDVITERAQILFDKIIMEAA